MKKLEGIDFYLVTDSELSINGIFSDVESAVNAGCKIVQYREKNKSTAGMIKDAFKLKKICEDKAIFLVNDRIDVALAVNADGVHIGQDDMSFETARKILGDKIIGLTVHNVEEAISAQKIGADYVGLSPIFATSTKKDAGFPCGVEMISGMRNKISIPIVAIGGINKKNVPDVIKNGADSAAAISVVVGVDNVKSEVEEFIKIINENKK